MPTSDESCGQTRFKFWKRALAVWWLQTHKKKMQLECCGYTPPLPYPPLLPSDATSPVSSFPSHDHWEGTPSLDHGRTAAKPTISARQRINCTMRYLHHAPPRPHTRPHTLTTPLYATTLHSHMLPPAHTPAPHSHLCFGYKQPVTGAPLGFVSAAAKDRATPHINSNHSINTRKHPTPTRLGKVYKGALVVPPSSPHQRAFICGKGIDTAQVGVSLVSLFDPLFKRFRLHCFDVCLT